MQSAIDHSQEEQQSYLQDLKGVKSPALAYVVVRHIL